MLKRSRVIRVQFDVVLPCDATREQVLEWIAFELHYAGGCDGDNPLIDYDLEAMAEPVLNDTHRHLHERVEIDRVEGNSTYFRTHRSLLDEPSPHPPADEQMRAAHLAKT